MNEDQIYKVTDLTWDGRGVARDEDGRVVMLPGALPGDRVTADCEYRPGKGAISATVREIVTTSALRVNHPCPHYAEGCPGSPLGAMHYGASLGWKRQHLQETLRRVGHVEDRQVREVIPSPQLWGYRDRLELHLVPAGEMWRLAYLSRSGPVPIRGCRLGTRPIQMALFRLTAGLEAGTLLNVEDRDVRQCRLLLRDNGRDSAVAVVFVKPAGRDFDLEPIAEWLNSVDLAGWEVRWMPSVKARLFKSEILSRGGSSVIYREIAGRELVCNATVFLQVNFSLARELKDVVLFYLPDGETLLDLYGGFGAFAFDYARRGGRATVVESNTAAVRAGMEFVRQTGYRVDFIAGDLTDDEVLEKLEGEVASAVADPPRSGLHAPVIRWLNSSGPELFIYISCHPAALARDIARLTEYRVRVFQPIDLFPATPDLEVVAVLDRI